MSFISTSALAILSVFIGMSDRVAGGVPLRREIGKIIGADYSDIIEVAP